MNDTYTKKVLIVGANSYIGQNFARYSKNQLQVDVVDSYKEWKEANFKGYNSILMVAGLAHKRPGTSKDMYFTINRDLALAVAKKARASGVGQFIYISSMAVYGQRDGEITRETKPNPKKNDFYGISKFQAEERLCDLFYNEPANPGGLCIIRPPMVYGPGCPGNFSRLVSLATRLPFFPDINNKRSMIYIDNLCAYIMHVIKEGSSGVFLPQNKEYVNTTALVQLIAKLKGREIKATKILNPLVALAGRFIPAVGKMFGSLVYKDFDDSLIPVDFEDSIRQSIL